MTTERAYRTLTQVEPGRRIEFDAPELAEGQRVEVFGVPREAARVSGAFLDMTDSPPAEPRAATTWDAVETKLQADRDA